MKFKKLRPFGISIDFNTALEGWPLRELVFEYSLVLIKRAKFFSDDQFIDWASQLSTQSGELKEKLLHWDFGPLMEMKFSLDSPNYLFSQEKVPFHWDGAFYRPPKFLVFYCTHSSGAGGETFFTNTSKVWDSCSESFQKALKTIRLRYRTKKLAHYGGEIEVSLVQKHPDLDSTILRFAEKVESRKNPVHLKIDSPIVDKEDFYSLMADKIYSNDFCYLHQWEEGDLLIVDNFSSIHGRNPLNSNLKRTFKRVQVL